MVDTVTLLNRLSSVVYRTDMARKRTDPFSPEREALERQLDTLRECGDELLDNLRSTPDDEQFIFRLPREITYNGRDYVHISSELPGWGESESET